MTSGSLGGFVHEHRPMQPKDTKDSGSDGAEWTLADGS